MPQADDGRTVDLRELETSISAMCVHLEGDEDAFRRIVETLPVPLAVLQAADGKILYTNSCLDETLGVARGSLLDGDWGYIFPNISDRRRLKKVATKGGGVRGIELRCRHKNGTPLWVSVWQRRVVCHSRECMLTILVDVTGRKADESRQREKRKALRRLLEANDRDRELIACEVHDGLLQQMTGALMRLEVARIAINKGKADSAEQVEAATGLVREAIKEARSLIDGVRPPDLDKIGLAGALKTFVDKTAASSDIEIEFVHRLPSMRMGPNLEATIYRIVQESLNNVWRHSESTKAYVELSQHDDNVIIKVRDWGIGFDPAQVNRKSFGLTSIKQRTRLLGGSVTIDSVRKEGTTICAELPLTESPLGVCTI
ncbi:MAG: PAS domain S-box protein [Pirellulaceae bacterium]|nr:PAS domain S-box protein [Pirellulaceae bacterium]